MIVNLAPDTAQKGSSYRLQVPAASFSQIVTDLASYINVSKSPNIWLQRGALRSFLKFSIGKYKIANEGKICIIDLFSKIRIIVRCSGSDDSIQVALGFEINKRQYAFSEGLVLLDGNYLVFIVGQFLYGATVEIPQQLMEKNNIVLHRKKAELFKEELALFEDCQLVWDLQDAMQPSLLPLLELTDRTGGFARLAATHNGKRVVAPAEIFRDWERDLIESGYQKKQVGAAHYYCPLHMVFSAISLLIDVGWQVITADGKGVKKITEVQFSATEAPEGILLDGVIAVEDGAYAIQTIASKLRGANLICPADEKTSILIDWKALQLSPELLSNALISNRGIVVPRFHIGLLQPMYLDNSIKGNQLLAALFEPPDQMPTLPLFSGDLFAYQQVGVAWMLQRVKFGFSMLLSDEMGLGKTIQIIALLSLMPSARVLLVTPSSLCVQWSREFARFYPTAALTLYQGSNRSIAREGITLTSYAMLRIDNLQFALERFDLIILDEAQYIKNPDAATTKAAYGLQGMVKISMTGTPIENSIEDMWSQFQFLYPDLLGSRSQMQALAQLIQVDPRHAEDIKKKIAPFVLRRTKQEVALQLPEKMIQTIYVAIDGRLREMYDTYIQQVHLSSKTKMQLFELLLRLRQLVVFPWAVFPDYDGICHKMEQVIEDATEIIAQKEKVIIFSTFVDPIQMMHKRLPGFYIDGSVKNRDEILHQFSTATGGHVLYMSLKVGGVGLNLTAADYVLIYDPWWNEAVEKQAIDRAHRIGRVGRVIARRYIASDTIEEKIEALKKQKEKIANALFEEMIDLSTLSFDEVLSLL